MSSIPNGGANLYIAPGAYSYWVFHWNSGGWQGDTLLQPQPLNTGAKLITDVTSVDLDSTGHYQFNYYVHNTGPNSTYFNIQASNN